MWRGSSFYELTSGRILAVTLTEDPRNQLQRGSSQSTSERILENYILEWILIINFKEDLRHQFQRGSSQSTSEKILAIIFKKDRRNQLQRESSQWTSDRILPINFIENPCSQLQRGSSPVARARFFSHHYSNTQQTLLLYTRIIESVWPLLHKNIYSWKEVLWAFKPDGVYCWR
jgi:hypothetical protein